MKSRISRSAFSSRWITSASRFDSGNEKSIHGHDTRGHVLADFPIHRCLQTILDRERAAFDKQIALKRRQTDDPLEGRHKFRVPDGVNVRIGDLNFCGPQKIASNLRL